MSLIWTPPPRKVWTPSRKLQRGFFGLPGGMGAAFPSGGGGPPPLSTDIKWYLRGEGANGQTTTVDSSTFARPTTMGGGAQITTAHKVCGVGSLDLNGSNAFVETAPHADFQVGSGNHAIRCKLRITSLASAACVFWYGNDGNFYDSLSLIIATDGSIGYNIFDGSGVDYISTAPGALSTGSFYEVLCGRDGSNLRMAINGTFITPTAASRTVGVPSISPTVQIGAWYGATYRQAWFPGQIDEFQFIKGNMPHTSNYSPASCFY